MKVTTKIEDETEDITQNLQNTKIKRICLDQVKG